MACLSFAELIFQFVFFAQVSARHYELNHCHKEKMKDGRLWFVFCIFFLSISRAHKPNFLPISISPCPFHLLTCDFSVVCGNLKPVRDHRCQDLHDCHSFGRICFFKTTKAVNRNLLCSYSISKRKKNVFVGCMVFNKISRPSWFRLFLFLVFTQNSILAFHPENCRLTLVTCFHLKAGWRVSLMSASFFNKTQHLSAKVWQQSKYVSANMNPNPGQVS